MRESAEVLNRIGSSLEHAIAQVTMTETAWAKATPTPRPRGHADCLALHAEKRRVLATKTEQLTEHVGITEKELEACELELRELSARTESLRRKLAEWAVRAIG